MEHITLKIKRRKNQKGEMPPMPKYATSGSAGLDLYAFCDMPVKIEPKGLVMIETGIHIELPGSGYAAMIYARSGLAVKHGIALSNGVGVIDSDYRGEIKIGLCNVSDKPYTINPGERIAQMVVMPISQGIICEVEELLESDRGEGGFGSTGK